MLQFPPLILLIPAADTPRTPLLPKITAGILSLSKTLRGAMRETDLLPIPRDMDMDTRTRGRGTGRRTITEDSRKLCPNTTTMDEEELLTTPPTITIGTSIRCEVN
jgi:hypothetical protein